MSNSILFFLISMTLGLSLTAQALECQPDWRYEQCELVELIQAPNPYVVVTVQEIECDSYYDGISCRATIHYADIVGYGETRATEATCEEAILYRPGSGQYQSEEIRCD